jgi:hypothetical protein
MLKDLNFDIKSLENGVKILADSIADYRVEHTNPTPLLYQSGYLTIKDYNAMFNQYILGFPNEEVKYGFFNELLYVYMPEKDMIGEFNAANFVQDLWAKALFNAIYNGHYRYNKKTAALKKSANDTVYMARKFGDMEFEYIKSSADIRKIIISLGDYGLSIADANGSVSPLSLVKFVRQSIKIAESSEYLNEEQRELAADTAREILLNADFFIDKANEYLRSKYNMSIDDSLRNEAAELAESDENADESSPMELGRVQKMHNINYNRVDASTTSAALVRAVINSLRRDSSIDPSTGLPVFEVSRKTWYEIPNLLGNVKSVDKMMKVIHEASLKPEYSKYYPTGQRDPVNFLTSLYNRLSSMNSDHKALFLNSVRLYKNKYIKFNEEGFGREKEIVSEYEPYRQYKAVKDSWAIRFMSKDRVTKASIAELNKAIADVKMLVKDAREFQEIPTLSEIADPLIKALNGIGFTGVTRGAIAYILGADLASKDSEYIADAIEDLIGAAGEFISSARMLGNLMNEKEDKLWNTVRLRKKEYTKSQFINLLPMTHKLARAVTEDLGTAKLNTVIRKYFSQVGCHALNPARVQVNHARFAVKVFIDKTPGLHHAAEILKIIVDIHAVG